MTGKTANLAWLVQVEEKYGSRQIRAHVVIPQENGELHNPSFDYRDRPGKEFADFTVSAYLGNLSGFTQSGGEIWGLSHEFQPFKVADLAHAKALASVFGKVARGLAKAETESGYVRDGDFHAYLLRIAGALGIRTYYVRNGKRARDVSGETFRKVTPATLQWWIGDVSQVAATNPADLDVRQT